MSYVDEIKLEMIELSKLISIPESLIFNLNKHTETIKECEESSSSVTECVDLIIMLEGI